MFNADNLCSLSNPLSLLILFEYNDKFCKLVSASMPYMASMALKLRSNHVSDVRWFRFYVLVMQLLSRHNFVKPPRPNKLSIFLSLLNDMISVWTLYSGIDLISFYIFCRRTTSSRLPTTRSLYYYDAIIGAIKIHSRISCSFITFYTGCLVNG